MSGTVLFSPKQVQELISTGNVVFIDVRDSKDFEAGHLPGAVNMPDIFT